MVKLPEGIKCDICSCCPAQRGEVAASHLRGEPRHRHDGQVRERCHHRRGRCKEEEALPGSLRSPLCAQQIGSQPKSDRRLQLCVIASSAIEVFQPTRCMQLGHLHGSLREVRPGVHNDA